MALVKGLEGALIAGLAYDADTQKPAGLGDQGGHTAVLCHIVQAFQGEDEMSPLHIAADFCFNLFKALSGMDELPELFGDQGQLRAGREAVQAADAPSRVRGFILLLGLYSCVVAAGQTAGNRQSKYGICVAEGFQPFMDIRTGGCLL